MKESRIVAVDHVYLESQPGFAEELVWFYSELVALDWVGDQRDIRAAGLLRFKSGQLEIRYRLVDEPKTQPVACRATVLVPSLLEIREILDERRVPYEPVSGVVYTDRRIGLLDAAGNRIELKQQWPYAPI